MEVDDDPPEWKTTLKTIWHCEKVQLDREKKKWTCLWCRGTFTKNATKATAHLAKVGGHDIAVSKKVADCCICCSLFIC